MTRSFSPGSSRPSTYLQQEFALGVVAADAEGGLRQVVGAEAEEVGDGGDLVGGQSGARQLDHRAELVLDGRARLGGDLLCHRFELAAHLLQFVDMPDQRDHDLGLQFLALLRQFARGFEDGTRLHDVDLREEQAQAAAAQAQHGVHLAHGSHGFEHLALLCQLLFVAAQRLQARHLDQQLFIRGQELVQRRVDQADDDRVALARLRIDHGLEDALEVAALERQQLIERGLALLFRLGQDHLLHDGQALLLHKHMLGAAEADALRRRR